MTMGLGIFKNLKQKHLGFFECYKTILRPSNVLSSRNISSNNQFGKGDNREAKNNTTSTQMFLLPFIINSNLSNVQRIKDQIKLPSYSSQTLVLPTPNKNKPIIAYIDRLAILGKIDPITTKKELPLIENEQTKPLVRKEAAVMLRIRRRKMRKHKRKKFIKKFRFFLEKQFFRKEKKKEQLFQAKLLQQIKEAESFDAEKYVNDILKKIQARPKPETIEERKERSLDMRRKYRSNVNVIRPKFEED